MLTIGKITFSILGLGPIFGINWSFCSSKKKFSIDLTEGYINFCLSLHYNADNSYLFVNGEEIFKSKADNKNVNFPTRFCLGSISDGFSSSELQFNW